MHIKVFDKNKVRIDFKQEELQMLNIDMTSLTQSSLSSLEWFISRVLADLGERLGTDFVSGMFSIAIMRFGSNTVAVISPATADSSEPVHMPTMDCECSRCQAWRNSANEGIFELDMEVNEDLFDLDEEYDDLDQEDQLQRRNIFMKNLFGGYGVDQQGSSDKQSNDSSTPNNHSNSYSTSHPDSSHFDEYPIGSEPFEPNSSFENDDNDTLEGEADHRGDPAELDESLDYTAGPAPYTPNAREEYRYPFDDSVLGQFRLTEMIVYRTKELDSLIMMANSPYMQKFEHSRLYHHDSTYYLVLLHENLKYVGFRLTTDDVAKEFLHHTDVTPPFLEEHAKVIIADEVFVTLNNHFTL